MLPQPPLSMSSAGLSCCGTPPAPFPAGAMGQGWSQQGRQGLRGAQDRKYITAFYRKLSGSQMAGKRCCSCPPILPEIQFSQSSPHLPRAYLLLQLQGQSGSRAWKLEFFQLKNSWAALFSAASQACSLWQLLNFSLEVMVPWGAVGKLNRMKIFASGHTSGQVLVSVDVM